jgi:Type I phosphodiesterase / nucleotide pyrophosphatase
MGVNPTIVLEFNELSPSLMDVFISRGILPNFQALRDQSQVFVSDAEEESPNLEPWIQWVTAHTGLSFREHGIFDLGDGHKLTQPRLWEILSSHGYSVWICGSMNAAFHSPIKGHILPDPWSTGISPHPAGEFDTYFNYVRRNVQEHSRKDSPLGSGDHLKFLTYMATHGLSAKTASWTAQRLLEERRTGRGRWKRATVLDRFQWDVFCHYWRRNKPDFSTFFLNSTAHLQHLYWRNMQPERFRLAPSSEDQADHANAIEYGYRAMDAIVGECLQLAGAKANVILCTALGQQPCLAYEEKGGKTFYRIVSAKDFFRFVGITTPYEYAPVMSEQFHLYFESEAAAEPAEALLKAVRMADGNPVMMVRREGREIFAGCTIFRQVEPATPVISAAGDSTPFRTLLYQAAGLKSGMHHPDGILWIRQAGAQPRVHKSRVPLRAYAPTILSLYGVDPPAGMADPLPGFGAVGVAAQARV